MRAGLPRPKRVSSSRLVPISRSIPLRRSVGHCGQRVLGQEDTVDDGKEGQRDHPRVRTSPARSPRWRRRVRWPGLRSSDSRSHDASPSTAAMRSAERSASSTVCTCTPPLCTIGAAEESLGGGRAEQRGHAEAPGGLAEDRDVARIATEGGDVVAHPAPARPAGRGCPSCPTRPSGSARSR